MKLDFSADAVTFTCAACLDTLVVERRLTMSAAPVEPTFTIEVDSEHKAKSLNIFSFNHPHHASFHMSWIGFFVSFVSTFAAAPMVAIIREDLVTRAGKINSSLMTTFLVNLGLVRMKQGLFDIARSKCEGARRMAEAAGDQEVSQEAENCLDQVKAVMAASANIRNR